MEQLFRYYVDLGHELELKKLYYKRLRRISRFLSGFLLLTSAGSIVTLSCWQKFPVLWVVISLAAQVIQTLQPLMDFSKKRDALGYIIQDERALFDQVCLYWNKISRIQVDDKTEYEIDDQVLAWKTRQREIRNRFLPDLDITPSKRMERKAKELNCRYFWYYYNVQIEEDLDHEQQPIEQKSS